MEAGRGFAWLPVAFGIGIAIYFALPVEPVLWPLAAASCGLAAASFMLRHRSTALRIVVLITLAVAGVTVAKIRTDHVAAPRLSREMTVMVTGWVAWLEEAPRVGVRLHVRIHDIDGLEETAWPRSVRITIRNGGDGLAVGDAIRVRARLIPPSGPVLPGGFDFARRAYYAGLGAVGFSYGRPDVLAIGDPPFDIGLIRPLARLREAIRIRVEAALDGDIGEVAAALITGDRGGISPATQEAMRASGLGHILAISGLHMALVAGSVFWIVRALLALSPALALGYPIKKWSAAVALVTAAFYLALSGAGTATQRAFVMLMIMLVAIMVDRRAITLRNVALAAFFILLVTPESLFSVSFQMSFAATTALVAAYEVAKAWRYAGSPTTPVAGRAASVIRAARGLALTSLIAGLATAPFALFHFQRVAPLTLLANLAAMPAVGLVVMPMALLAVVAMPFGVEAVPLAVMGYGLQWVVGVATIVADWSGGSGQFPMAPPSALLALTVGFLWITLWRRPWRLAGFLPIFVAGVLAATAERPDLLVDEEASAVAVRAADGRYRILRRSGARFVTDVWLRSDGDRRPRSDRDLGQGVSCDSFGCVARSLDGSPIVSLITDDLALAEDCRLADIVVTRHEAPELCGEQSLVIDGPMLERHGAHAIYGLTAEDGPSIRTAYPEKRRPFMPAGPQ